MTDMLLAPVAGFMIATASTHPEITPPIDGLGGALGRHVGGDGGIAAMSGGLGIAAVVLLALLALALGVVASRAVTER
jgi:hypothetical protein